jgi:hypothetical protein
MGMFGRLPVFSRYDGIGISIANKAIRRSLDQVQVHEPAPASFPWWCHSKAQVTFITLAFSQNRPVAEGE